MKLTNIRNPLPSTQAAASSIINLTVSGPVTMPLVTRWGTMKPLVSEGDPVAKGQRVAQSEDIRLPAVYASVAGTVTAVTSCVLHDGRQGPAIVIEGSCNDAGAASEPGPVPEDPLELAARLIQAGIDEVDPYPWPLSARLAAPEVASKALQLTDAPFDQAIDTLILNGIDRQPGDQLRRTVLAEAPDVVLAGALAAKRLASPGRIVFALAAGRTLPDELSSGLQEAGVEIRSCPDRYPVALEPVLVQFITGKEVPQPAGDARSIGVAVVDVVTLSRLGEAATRATPVLDTLVQVAAAGRLQVVRVPIGTSVQTVIEQLNGDSSHTTKAIIGGLCLGYAQYDYRAPLTQRTDSIVLQAAAQMSRTSNQACINCGNCVHVCPMNLLPNELGKFCEYGKFMEAKQQFLSHCIECGLCAFVCPAKRPMVQLMRYGKKELLEMGMES